MGKKKKKKRTARRCISPSTLIVGWNELSAGSSHFLLWKECRQNSVFCVFIGEPSDHIFWMYANPKIL